MINKYKVIFLFTVCFFLAGRQTALAAPQEPPALNRGSLGPEVAALQMRLAHLGYRVGLADGLYDMETSLAVREFQDAHDLPIQDAADQTTLQHVRADHDSAYGPLHIAQEGETLFSVAEAYGIEGTTVSLLNLKLDPALEPGEILRLPYWVAAEAGRPAAAEVPRRTDTGAGEAPAAGAVTDRDGAGAAAHQPAAPETPGGTYVPPAPTWNGGGRYVVLGYYTEDWPGDRASLNSLRRSGGLVDLVANFQLTVDGQGNISTWSCPELMAESRTQGVPVQGLVHNWTDGGFSAEVARVVVSDPAVRDRTIQNLLTAAREQGLSGINVDLELVPADQRQSYTEFVRLLAGELHARGLQLTLSVPGKNYDDTVSRWDGAYDYAALGALADYVVVMAYDQHLPGLEAGPVASYPWVASVARFAASQIPSQKVLLGIASYGYDWVQGSTQGRGISAWGAESLAAEYGASIQWDAEARVPYFTYWEDGVPRIVYFENESSTAEKLGLVEAYGLGGIAIWRLGLEDPDIWAVISSRLS